MLMEINVEESTIHKNLIEAALFMSPKPLNLDELMKATGIGSLGYLKDTLKDLQKDYFEKGLEIIENPEGWHMKVKKEYLPRVAHLTPNSDLSEGCKKALALIIYKEPFKQSELIKIQGTKAYEYAKELEKRGLIKRERSGHTKILKATGELENYFGETKEQIRKRISQAMDGWEPSKIQENGEKQTTIDEYPKNKEQAEEKIKVPPKSKNVNRSHEKENAKKELNRQLESALDNLEAKELSLDEEFSSEPRIVKSQKSNLKPIKRERQVKIRFAKNLEKEAVKLADVPAVLEEPCEQDEKKKMRKAAGLAGIKELTLEDLKK